MAWKSCVWSSRCWKTAACSAEEVVALVLKSRAEAEGKE